MLKDLVQIYMPDMRYADNAFAGRYSDVGDYVKYNRQSVREMYEPVSYTHLDVYKRQRQ